jgi:signal recognition particle GTPase
MTHAPPSRQISGVRENLAATRQTRKEKVGLSRRWSGWQQAHSALQRRSERDGGFPVLVLNALFSRAGMVLAELGTRITNALRSVGSKTVIDKEAVDGMLKEIGNALVAADVNFKLVMTLRSNLLAKLVRAPVFSCLFVLLFLPLFLRTSRS